jgi:predicted HTH transcriptional regulator
VSELQRTQALIVELRQLPAETSWVEFKENNNDAQMIGKLISALSNAARLANQPFAYVLWGVRDADHAAVGTTFEPSSQLQQNQPLELWLAQRLQPAIAFNFKPVDDHGTRLVLLEIPAASHSPVEFDRQAFVRVGSATPRLSDHPERLKALWAKLQPYAWETGVAAQFLSGDEVLARLDYAAYFDLTSRFHRSDRFHRRPDAAQ